MDINVNDLEKYFGKTHTNNSNEIFIVTGLHSKDERGNKRYNVKFLDDGSETVALGYNILDGKVGKKKTQETEEGTRVLVIGDVHAPFSKSGYREFCIKMYRKHKCNKVVFIGDIIDNHYSSFHDSDPNGMGASEELQKAIKEIALFYKAFPDAKVCIGNHDCYDEETEILTTVGWKKGVELTEEDVVATYNMDKKTIEYQKPKTLIKRKVEGEMIEFKTQSIDLLVTPGHRMMFMEKEFKVSDSNYKIKEAYKLNSGMKYFALSSNNNKKDVESFNDDMIKLMAWVASDGSVLKGGRFVLYQSKNKGLVEIERILNSLGIEFVKKCRIRETEEICGKELKNKPLDSFEFYFRCDWLSCIYKDKYILPKELRCMSKRQIDIFINSFIDGDGTRYSDSSYRKDSEGEYTSSVIYGTEEMIDQLQSLCISNGWKATKRKYREKDFKLNLVPDKLNEGIRLNKQSKLIEYNGYVWCAEVENSTLVVRRNGNVSIQGNCLADRKAFKHGLSSRWIRTLDEVLNTPNWEFKDSFVIGDFLFTHGTGRNAKIRCKEDFYSVVQGHYHSESYVEHFVGSNGERKMAVQVGCGIDREKYAFSYGKNFKSPHINVAIIDVENKIAFHEYMN
ncbi:MAG: metallophosphoesterase [Sarcina sp.]